MINLLIVENSEEVFPTKKTWLSKILYLSKIRKLSKLFDKLDYKKPHVDKDLLFSHPASIDSIPLIAVLELKTYLSKPPTSSTLFMLETVTIACFSSNSKDDYDTKSDAYLDFKDFVNHQPPSHVVGLFNHIVDQIKEADELWQERFFKVEVTDKHYIQAGGNRMSMFNVISTLELICKTFNITDTEAKQKAFGITQAVALKQATASHIQHEMSKLKEAEMKLKRNN